jgi:hypothetical protein
MLNVQYFKGKDFTCKIFYANQHPLVEKRIIRIERGKCCAYKKIILKLHANISGK